MTLLLHDAKHVKNFLLVRYEDFVAAPRETLPRIAEFLDLQTDDIGAARTSIRDMNGWSIGRLDEAALRAIANEVGDFLATMGYARLTEPP